MSEYQLRARIPHELADEVKAIVEDINSVLPEAEATFSTVARYALRDYVRRAHQRQAGIVPIEIPTQGRSLDELKVIRSALSVLEGLADVSEAISKVESAITSAEIHVLMEERRNRG